MGVYPKELWSKTICWSCGETLVENGEHRADAHFDEEIEKPKWASRKLFIDPLEYALCAVCLEFQRYEQHLRSMFRKGLGGG